MYIILGMLCIAWRGERGTVAVASLVFVVFQSPWQ